VNSRSPIFIFQFPTTLGIRLLRWPVSLYSPLLLVTVPEIFPSSTHKAELTVLKRYICQFVHAPKADPLTGQIAFAVSGKQQDRFHLPFIVIDLDLPFAVQSPSTCPRAGAAGFSAFASAALSTLTSVAGSAAAATGSASLTDG
jgi:hypothetical protein